ncbi:DUF1254 domain-containing protein [uncultured Algoriphagus sp.]|uniref:DUF1254 domain-containing protein n=1 Tax=uncultured Algoriphagus sp. TaxID=417365 RepID=UPI002594EC8F|nr:DUF1254 domain-containing protein [uncultured Algoriphagus sp.]
MKKQTIYSAIKSGLFLVALIFLNSCNSQEELRPEEARAIAKEAYTYANPMVDHYRGLYNYFMDRNSSDYKGPWNKVINMARVYTHEDRTIQTANSDTPYSFVAMDLRSEPMVLSLPEIEEGRYYSVQLIDMYTHNFEFIGTRTTGNNGGHFLIAGPGWEGEIPDGIEKLIQSETEWVLGVYRTQLFNPDDLDNVKQIQSEYTLQPLSSFLDLPAPEAAPDIQFIEPLTQDEIKGSPKVFEQLNYLLQFCPTHPSEKELMSRFAKLGIGAGQEFNWHNFSPEVQDAIKQGMADAWEDFAIFKSQAEAGEIGSAEVFGTRKHLNNNYSYRMAGAVLGIWGASAEEAIYPSYYVDSENEQLNGANEYTLRFEPGQLPPVNAFWSLTMYELPASLLAENPLNRYLLNSPMMDDFVFDEDGGLTLYFQNESPGKEKESNWLPAPKGPFSVVMRLYLPRPEVLDGTWKQPKIYKVN